MGKKKFKYNPSTLSFDPIETSLLKKFANLTIQFISSLAIAIILFFSFTYFYDTPKEKILKREQSEIALKFDILDKKLAKTNLAINDIQIRDNHTYRAIFEADTIPSTLREGGMGGVNKYEDYQRYSNSTLLIDIATKIDKITWKTYIQSKSFDEVIDLAKNKEKMILSIPAIQPIAIDDLHRISDYYGVRRDPFLRTTKFHNGIDFAGSKGVPIYATGNGKVERAEYSFFGYGNVVIVDHGFGYKSRYAHLNSIKVKSGDPIVRGQIVGTLGTSGRSTGPHLHYEVILRNKTVDPMNYFNEMSSEEYSMMVSNVNESN